MYRLSFCLGSTKNLFLFSLSWDYLSRRLSDETDLNTVFIDNHELSLKCKFSDCRHQNEPNCAIIAALENNEINEERWLSYLKLNRELAFDKRKVDKVTHSENKKKWAKQSQRIRERNKWKGPRGV